jgi:hypothetical protein
MKRVATLGEKRAADVSRKRRPAAPSLRCGATPVQVLGVIRLGKGCRLRRDAALRNRLASQNAARPADVGIGPARVSGRLR